MQTGVFAAFLVVTRNMRNVTAKEDVFPFLKHMDMLPGRHGAAAVVASGAFLPGAQVALKNLGFAGFGYCG